MTERSLAIEEQEPMEERGTSGLPWRAMMSGPDSTDVRLNSPRPACACMTS